MQRCSGWMMLAISALLAIQAAAFIPYASRSLSTGVSVRPTTPRICTIQAMSPKEEGDAMMKSLADHLDHAKGSEALPAKTAERIIHEARGDAERVPSKFMGSKRLGKMVALVSSSQEEANLKTGFNNMINELKGLLGTESFSGKEAEKALREAVAVETEAEKDEGREVMRLLGSRRLYKLINKGTDHANRPHGRKNHPGETIQQSRH